ncbi:hypothetical protein [Rhodoblastus sp.]|uniref:hypothetical protein n=1 Tax=Rhodoblastus sp. TaxID=1962975 RepID=UPI003F9D1FD1
MRTSIICQECSRINNNWAVFYLDTFRDDGVYFGCCPKGHDNAIATQTLRHEMLFEIGVNAIKDTYYREAISSFAASVERYYEFAIRVICRHSKLADDVLQRSWKSVSRQSERQTGAYIFLYAATFREVAPTLSETMTSLRNDVIHKGILPDKAQAVEFGEASYQVIQNGVQKLRAECLDDVNAELVAQMRKTIEKYGDKFPRSTQVTQTALNIIQDISGGYGPFRQVLSARGIPLP